MGKVYKTSRGELLILPDKNAPTVYTAKISDLQPDPENANAGTERGAALLELSLRQHGAGRSVLLDAENRVIGGNKTTEGAAAIGLEDVIIVETDGTKLVAVKRTDLNLATDPEARMLAYYDNRTAEVGLAWLPEQLLLDLQQERPLGEVFTERELEGFFKRLGAQVAEEPLEPLSEAGLGAGGSGGSMGAQSPAEPPGAALGVIVEPLELYFEPAEHAEFKTMIHHLTGHFLTSSTAGTVVEAVRYAYLSTRRDQPMSEGSAHE